MNFFQELSKQPEEIFKLKLLQTEFKLSVNAFDETLLSKANYLKKMEEQDPGEQLLKRIHKETENMEVCLALKVATEGLIEGYNSTLQEERKRFAGKLEAAEKEVVYWKKECLRQMEENAQMTKDFIALKQNDNAKQNQR